MSQLTLFQESEREVTGYLFSGMFRHVGAWKEPVIRDSLADEFWELWGIISWMSRLLIPYNCHNWQRRRVPVTQEFRASVKKDHSWLQHGYTITDPVRRVNVAVILQISMEWETQNDPIPHKTNCEHSGRNNCAVQYCNCLKWSATERARLETPANSCWGICGEGTAWETSSPV